MPQRTSLLQRTRGAEPSGFALRAIACIREQHERTWQTHEQIDVALGDLLEHEIVWALRPTLHKVVGDQPAGRSHSAPNLSLLNERASDYTQHLRRIGLTASTKAARKRLRARLRPQASDRGTVWTSSTDGVLRVWWSDNLRLAIGGSKPDDSLPRDAQRTSDGIPLDDDLIAGLSEACGKLGVDAGPVIEEAVATYWFRESVKRHLDKHRPRILMTGMNHDRKSRLFESVARRRGVPSVYVPHAPTGLSRVYADLPADLVLLRGPRDLDYYTWCGARHEQMRVVGDPMVDLQGSSPYRDVPTIVLATSADRPARELRRFLELVEASCIGQFAQLLITPHPRGLKAAKELGPGFGLEVFLGRTSEALRARNVVAMVSETSSGALIEAEAMGIPTITVSPHANYAFECDLGIERVEGSDELCAAVEKLLASGGETPQERASMASSWIADSGASARTRIKEELASGVTTSGPVLDSWRI